jgi:hypothetical protein
MQNNMVAYQNGGKSVKKNLNKKKKFTTCVNNKAIVGM